MQTPKEKNMMDADNELPEVGGRSIDCSNAMFERRCRLALKAEQEKISPDNALIAVLCDAVRIAREYTDAMRNIC
jgi:indole-3-glycerol phosphate synthase